MGIASGVGSGGPAEAAPKPTYIIHPIKKKW